ncbi:MAG: YtxH domain-containing protein [Spirochaetales bacterium]|nr:YtxH domain-containing protein [Spirochaetales bacterium]
MGFILGTVAGAVLAYLFHPQIDKVVRKVIRNVKSRSAVTDRAVPEDRD